MLVNNKYTSLYMKYQYIECICKKEDEIRENNEQE